MATAALMGIDIGTSSCKALLLDETGTVLATGAVAYDVSAPRPGWSEQDPADWIEGARTAIAGVLGRVPGVAVRGIGLSGQMHGLVALDAGDRVLRPAILWNDQRNAAECAEIAEAAGGTEVLLAATNNRMLPGYTGGKIRWLRNHEPEHFRRMRHVLNPKDYLRLRLTGERATEVSDASGTGLFDVRRRVWSDVAMEAAEVDRGLLPVCYESHVVSGGVSGDAAALCGLPQGTPVAGGGGDSVIQTLGSGVITPGDLQTTVGTAGILAAALGEPVRNPDGRLQVFCNVAPGTWHCMGVSLNAGGALAWLRDLLGGEATFEKMIARAAKSPAGARGLVFLPYLNGERCPHPDPAAKGAFIGLTSRHGEADMIRSLLEGVIFALRDIFGLMAGVGVGTSRIRASGGGAASALWRQIQADIFDCDIVTTDGAVEGGAYGAALVAGVGVGVWPDAAAAAGTCRISSRQAPDPAARDVYARMFEVYRSLYPALTASFRRLSAPLFAERNVA